MAISNDYDISVLILTYNTNKEKLFKTIESAIIQNNRNVQVVITDNGLKEDYFNDIRTYITKNSFLDYKLVKNGIN